MRDARVGVGRGAGEERYPAAGVMHTQPSFVVFPVVVARDSEIPHWLHGTAGAATREG